MSKVIPNDWSRAKLGDYIGVQGGNAFKSEYFSDNGVPIIRISNIKKDGSVNLKGAVYFEKDSNLAKFKAIKGDILIAMSGATTGKVGRYKSDVFSYINQRVGRFFLKKTNEGCIDFIHQITSEDEFTNSVLIDAVGGAQPNISNQQIESILVNFPPLSEQQKIAKILISVDDVIEKIQEQIDKLKDLKTGMMQELLTNGIGHTEFKGSPVGRIPAEWRVKELGDVFALKNGVNKGKEAFGKGIPIISYRNVYNGGGIFDNKLSGLVDLTESELSRFKVDYGDIFITRTSETPDEIGLVNVYLGNRNDVVYSGFVIRGRQKEKQLLPEYCKYAFQSFAMRKQMILNSKFTTRAGISGEALVRLKLPIPSLNEQRGIAESIGAIDNKINVLSEKLKCKKNIKKALMQDLLTGKVRVKIDSE